MKHQEEEPPESPKRRRRGRKRLTVLVLFLGALVWLNGPGWRWLGGIGLRHALDSAGLSADFELTGTLIGGVRLERLSLSGGMIRKLEIGSAGPLYHFTRALRGEIDGVEVERIDAIIDLAAPPLPGSPEEETPSEPKSLHQTLQDIRTLLLPMKLAADGLRFQLVRGDEALLTLESTDFHHAPGSDDFRLDLGSLAAAEAGYEAPAQQVNITWSKNQLLLDQFQLSSRLGISELRLELPAADKVSGSVVARVEESNFIISGDLSSASVRLEGDPLKVQEALKNFDMEIPAAATIRTLEAKVNGLDGAPEKWQATARIEVVNLSYEEWEAERLTLDASKDGSRGKAKWNLGAFNGEIDGQADLTWRNLAAEDWLDFAVDTQISAPRLAPIFAALGKQLDFTPEGSPPLPDSSFTVDATIDSATSGIRSADVRWLLSPEKDAASLAGEARWTPDAPLSGTLGTDGLRATYKLDLAAKTYDAGAILEDFRPESLAPWAAAAGVELPSGMNASASWQGSGDFGPKPHRGSFEVTSFTWTRKDVSPLNLRTKGNYSWPESVELSDLTAITEGQTIHAEAKLADRLLKIPRIEWKDGETRLVGGQAEIPVPENPGDIKDFLKQEIPLNLFLESEWIDSARLAAWMPDKKSPLSEGSGRIHLVITGTPADPKINLQAELKGLRLPDQPDVPVTGATFSIDSADGSLKLSGEIRPESYPPLTLSGKMPFKPGLWADDPESVTAEKIEARVNIPRLDLARFSSFVPDAEKLTGFLEGYFTATGTIGKPDLSGELRLSEGTFILKNSPAPPVSKANLLVRLEGDRVRLENLSFESSGGTLKGSGSIGIADPAKPTFDFNFRATSLPLKRDEAMIVRADADLFLRGDLEQSTISGTVGIVDSLYYRDFEILPLRVPFTAPARPSLPAIDPEEKAADIPAPFANWALDVRVRTRDPVMIRGNLAKGSAIADIRVGGTLGDIQPQGNAIISDVTARLPFSTLKINNGALVFSPDNGLNPELNIRGTSTIGPYEVNIFFYGPVNAPKTALTSDPPLPESEIMTLLATGSTSDGLENGQAATMKAAQLLIEEWRRGRLPFAEQAAKILVLLNRVDVRIGEDDPLTGQRLNSASIELTDRIFVNSSVDKQGNTRVLGAFVLRFK